MFFSQNKTQVFTNLLHIVNESVIISGMLSITTELRDDKTSLESLRKEGKMPAVFYGRKEKTTPIVISQSDFKKVLKEAGESTVVTLKGPQGDLSALIHDVAYHPVLDEPLHADFYIIEADKLVEVNVSLEFVGVSLAEKEEGGVIVKVLHEVMVRGLPKDLPHVIKVNLELLKTLGDNISTDELKLPSGIEIALDHSETVVLVTVAKEEEEEPSTEFDADSVEVTQKGKGEDEGDEGETKTSEADSEEKSK